MASEAPSAILPRCSAEGCTNEASLACPTCKELGRTEGIAFCGKECFKLAWKVHKKVHATPQPTAPAPTSAAAPAPSVAPEVTNVDPSVAHATASVGKIQLKLKQKARDVTPNDFKMPESEEETYKLLCLGGRCYENDNNLPSALQAYRCALEIQLSLSGGRPTQDLAESYNNVSRVLLNCDYNDPALQLAVKAADAIEKCGAEKDATYAAIHTNLAEAATAMGNPKKAIEAYKKAIAVFEAMEGPDSEAVSLTHCNLGYAYKNSGTNYKEAMHHYLECLHIQERTNKINTVLGGCIHQNIGKLYHVMGDLDNAQKFLERALELRILVLGAHHSDVGVCYCSIGEVYASRNNLAKALEYYQKDLEVTEKAFGRNHSAVAAAHMNISTTSRKMNNIPLALAHCKVAAEIIESVLGKDDSELGVILLDLGTLLALSGDLNEGLKANMEALRIAINSPPRYELSVPLIRQQIAGLQAAIKAKAKGLKFRMEMNVVELDKSAPQVDGIFNRSSTNAVQVQLPAKPKKK